MKQAYLFMILLLVFLTVKAQNIITVQGRVVDTSNESLPGASVSELGTSNSTRTDKDGNYKIKVKSNATLVFSYIGYKRYQEAVRSRTLINIRLHNDQNDLNEVIVIGYGQTTTRKDATGAISSMSGKEIAKTPVQSVAQAMQGRIAGMQVSMPDGTPGSEPSIKIRGGMSISQSNEPLYVVDGVPQTDGLSFLDPMDIESIDVLKDVSSTAIYGARGANGVVLITTKQIKEGRLSVNYDGYYGIKENTKELNVMKPYDYAVLSYERSLSDQTKLDNFTTNYGDFADLEKNYRNRRGINWQDKAMGSTASSQYHKVSINGGGKETQFNLFYSLNKDDGTLLNSSSTKNIAKLSLNHKINKKLVLNGIVNYSNQKINGLGVQDGGTRTSIIQSMIQYRPLGGLNYSDEELSDFTLDPLDPSAGGVGSALFQSPVVTLNSQTRETSIRTLNANTSLQYFLTKKITYRGLVNYTEANRSIKSFNDKNSILAIRTGGPFGGITTGLTTRFNYNNTLTYADTFNKKHKVDFTIGQEYLYNRIETLGTGDVKGFPSVNLGWDNLGLGTLASVPQSSKEDDKLLSFFARGNYSYKGKYLFTGSLRLDGSSKFGDDSKWGVFPSAAIAWRAGEEEFIKSLNTFSDLKLRASYGQAGNNRIANYLQYGVFTNGNYPLSNQLVSAVFLRTLPNPNLKWEATKAFNLGLDVGFFRQRISLTAEYYDNRSKDLLYETRIPASSGFTTQLQNIGTTSSRGLELTLSTVNVRTSNFSWNSTFNIAFNRTKVLSLSEGEQSLLATSYKDQSDYILQVGSPVGLMYGYVRDGLYRVDEFDYNSANGSYTLKNGGLRDLEAANVAPGYIKFKDISGPNGTPDGVINQYDRTVIGNANPKYLGGLNNTFSYKNFDLGVFVNFNYGNDVYNATMLNNTRLDLEYRNSLTVFADRWTTINSSGQRVTDPVELAALNAGKNNPAYNGNGSGRLYSDIIEKASFLRISNVSLGYTFPKKWIAPLKISNLRVYVTGNNLYTFTNYSGYDPEVSVLKSAITPGVDFSAYPRARSFVAGVNLSL